MQSIPPTTANKRTQAQKKRGSMARKLLGANAKSYRLKLKLNYCLKLYITYIICYILMTLIKYGNNFLWH